jgi:hypothetical protein
VPTVILAHLAAALTPLRTIAETGRSRENRVRKAIEREIATGTYLHLPIMAKRFPESPRVKRLGLHTEEAIRARRICREGLVGRAPRKSDQALNASFVHRGDPEAGVAAGSYRQEPHVLC